MKYKPIRAIISGGGTGGHIFPAVSIANKLKELCPQTEILFVGAEGKMEMEKVPAAGYEIKGLPVVGIQRRLNWRNFKNNIQVPYKICKSLYMAGKILDEFKPDIAIGVGGYASAPLLWKAQKKGIPTLIQEQNSYAGLTNKILGKKASKICVAYSNMNKFFPEDKIVFTGNPIRKGISPATSESRKEGFDFYNLNPEAKHILITGGSLGSKTLNDSVMSWVEHDCPLPDDFNTSNTPGKKPEIEILWQCGKIYKKEADTFMEFHKKEIPANIKLIHFDFIQKMDLAYAVADIVIARSGASSISELCASQKATIFVPSPNVAEDHQTHNAMALVNQNAALMIKDRDSVQTLMKTALSLITNQEKINKMEENAGKMATINASTLIVEEIYKLLS